MPSDLASKLVGLTNDTSKPIHEVLAETSDLLDAVVNETRKQYADANGCCTLAEGNSCCALPGRVFHDENAKRARWLLSSPADAGPNTVTQYPLLTSLRGASLFTTATADVSLFRGRWMYEVTLCSDGLFQVGWTSPQCMYPFSSRLGVGDFPFTFSYDGHRQRVWNVGTVPSGVRWAAGDVVTCLLDITGGEMRFLHNGIEVGKCAIDNMDSPGCDFLDPMHALSPGISLSFNETCMINLGECLFQYPRDGFVGVNDATLCSRVWSAKSSAFLALSGMNTPTALPICSLLADKINMDPTDCDVAYWVMALCRQLVGLETPAVTHFITALTATVCDEARCKLVGTLMAALCFMAATFVPCSVKPTPSSFLRLVLQLAAIPAVQEHWLASPSFSVDLLNVFRIKSPNNYDLEQAVFPFDEVEKEGETADEQKARIERMTTAFHAKARLMHEKAFGVDDQCRSQILKALLNNRHGKRKVMQLLDTCIKEFADRPRGNVQKRTSPMNIGTALASRLFFVLAEVVVMTAEEKLEGAPEKVADVFAPRRVLSAASIESLAINRIGGNIQHILKRTPIDATARSSSDDTLEYDPLLMKVCILYTLAVKDRVMTACNNLMLRQRMQQGFVIKGDTPAIQDIIRATYWDAATLFFCGSDVLVRLSNTIVTIVDHYFATPEFSYIPIILVECFVDVLHFARKTSTSYSKLLQQYPRCILFFVDKFLHPSIAHNETSEYMMLSLGSIIDSGEAHRQTVVSVLQDHDEAKLMNWVMLAFNHFSHRMAWTLVIGILVRLNIGNGFNMLDLEEEQIDWSLIFPEKQLQQQAQQQFVSFEFYKNLIRKYILQGPWRTNDVADINGSPKTFFADLIDHVNWSLSELGAALADTSALPDESQMTAPELNKRRRCVSLFDLTRKLLHIMEFFIEVAFDIFFDSNAPEQPNHVEDFGDRFINVDRVVEVVTQSLARFCSHLDSNHLNRVEALHLQGMERIKKWKLLAPIVGILHNIVKGGSFMSNEDNPFLKALAKPGVEWSLEAVVHCFTSVDWRKIGVGSNNDKTSFVNNASILECFKEANAAHQRGAKLSDDDDGLVEDGLCLICAYQAIDTQFVPCGHQSCGTCIRRHLQSSSTCFFCNKKIESLQDIGGDCIKNPMQD